MESLFPQTFHVLAFLPSRELNTMGLVTKSQISFCPPPNSIVPFLLSLLPDFSLLEEGAERKVAIMSLEEGIRIFGS